MRANIDALTHASWRHIPTTYVYCVKDNALPLSMQETFVRDARATGAEIETIACQAGHSPSLSMPARLAGWIREVVEGDLEKERERTGQERRGKEERRNRKMMILQG
jgi:hypothetical protein